MICWCGFGWRLTDEGLRTRLSALRGFRSATTRHATPLQNDGWRTGTIRVISAFSNASSKPLMKITEALLAEHAVFHTLFDHVERTVPRVRTAAEVRSLAILLQTVMAPHTKAED